MYSIKGEAQHECVRFGKEFGLDFGLGFDKSYLVRLKIIKLVAELRNSKETESNTT